MDKRLEAILKEAEKYDDVVVVGSFEEAESSEKRKAIVFTGSDVYFTYKTNDAFGDSIFGEFVCWVEDELKEDPEDAYGAVDGFLHGDYGPVSCEKLDEGIRNDTLFMPFTPYTERGEKALEEMTSEIER